MRTRLGGVGADRLVGLEVQVAFDGKAERTTEISEFVHADVTKFRSSHTKITQAEGDVVETERGKQPSALGIGGRSPGGELESRL